MTRQSIPNWANNSRRLGDFEARMTEFWEDFTELIILVVAGWTTWAEMPL
jgi:hypothetical protein